MVVTVFVAIVCHRNRHRRRHRHHIGHQLQFQQGWQQPEQSAATSMLQIIRGHLGLTADRPDLRRHMPTLTRAGSAYTPGHRKLDEFFRRRSSRRSRTPAARPQTALSRRLSRQRVQVVYICAPAAVRRPRSKKLSVY